MYTLCRKKCFLLLYVSIKLSHPEKTVFHHVYCEFAFFFIVRKVLDVYVLKRPFLDEFMEKIGPKFEVIVFTASLAKYADPLLDLMDITKTVKWRLFREACFPYEGACVFFYYY